MERTEPSPLAGAGAAGFINQERKECGLEAAGGREDLSGEGTTEGLLSRHFAS